MDTTNHAQEGWLIFDRGNIDIQKFNGENIDGQHLGPLVLCVLLLLFCARVSCKDFCDVVKCMLHSKSLPTPDAIQMFSTMK